MSARPRSVAAAATSLAAAMLVACEVPLVEQDLSFDPLQGEWLACLNDGGGDHSTYMLFFPDASFRITERTFGTTDGTCGGAATSATHAPWTYELLAGVPARIGPDGPEVVARRMNIENTFQRVYTIVYVDHEAIPPLLYLGDLALDPLRDGTSPERRPNVLSASRVFTGR